MKMQFILARAALIATVFAAGLITLQSPRATAALTTEIPSGFDTQAWNTWLDTVVKTGTPTEMPNGIYLTKSRVEPADTTKSHQADYFSMVGGFMPDGSFTVDHIEGVSETWTITTDGQRDIDQWLFLVSRDGDLSRTLHMHLVETDGGQVLQDDVVPSTADESMMKWIAQLDSWYAVTSGTQTPALTSAPFALANDAGASGSHAGIMLHLLH